ncbi:hypothetical protein KX816_07515 [Sphingosinicellaceae bacterium]|nr:hypothetical protein KX816_07515 [Sphingosinicellaceae bacterium]
MSRLWRIWFVVWCCSIGVFGLVLAGGAIAVTSGPVRSIFSILHGGTVTLDPPLQFSLAVVGAVSIGWAVTLHLTIRAAIELGPQGRAFWHAINAGMVSWYAIDSILPVATGFWLNVIPNTVLVGMYLVGLSGSGALRARTSDVTTDRS